MNINIPEKQKNLSSSTDTTFFIVGPMRVQNELIALYLRGKTGDECFVLQDINHIPKDNPKNNRRTNLLFWDCQGKNLNGLLTELRLYINNNPSESRILLFNVPTDLEFQKEYVLKGIHGYFYEHDPLDNFMKGVQAVIEGKLWLSREMMTKCIFEGTDNDKSLKKGSDDLTERQIEILALIAVGATNDEIADKLCISSHTVKTHLYRIFKKINVPNRVQAALWAAKNL
ncbi:MAG: response regulator transcription factor [Desulfobacteraceae bacterium]|nr:response regulator transcription factor [Desulfobacteraceae bacterium]